MEGKQWRMHFYILTRNVGFIQQTFFYSRDVLSREYQSAASVRVNPVWKNIRHQSEKPWPKFLPQKCTPLGPEAQKPANIPRQQPTFFFDVILSHRKCFLCVFPWSEYCIKKLSGSAQPAMVQQDVCKKKPCFFITPIQVEQKNDMRFHGKNGNICFQFITQDIAYHCTVCIMLYKLCCYIQSRNAKTLTWFHLLDSWPIQLIYASLEIPSTADCHWA